MDAVISYVNGNDPLWREDYARTVGGDVLTKRFREWGTLEYLLRGIREFMPFVGNIFLVVSRESQVPSWLDRDSVKVVTHAEFIPAEFLPTFNSNTIEMFLYRIPGLSERFLYFNDDMFPVRECTEDDFFPGGRPAIGYTPTLLALIPFKRHVRCADSAARAASKGLVPHRRRLPKPFFLRPQHTVSPMLKSVCEEVWNRIGDRIRATISPVRTEESISQYLFLNYMYYTGISVNRRIPAQYFSLGFRKPEDIAAFIQNPGEKKLICINDAKLDEQSFFHARSVLLSAFGARGDRTSGA